MLKTFLICLWILSFGFLFLYSFVQVDLGLTLTRASFFQVIEKSFQYVGYFNRPLSTYLFVSIVVLLFLSYILTLVLVWKRKISGKTVWIITILGALILVFSYNAFSYDFFNYIFDARIFTHYNQNPYEHKALDYPRDPMLGFMHWTHRTYPYGPVWLGITVPLSFLGGGFFIITFYLFKILVVSSYVLSCFFIERISRKTKIVDPVFALAFFALNPYVLIESLVSAHNDIVMMMLALGGIYFLVQRKRVAGWIFLLLSIGIKFATGFLLPLFIWYPFSKRKNKDFLFFLGALICMFIPLYLVSARTTFQPWYFLLVFPFAPFLSNRYYILIPFITFSFLVLSQYIPFLFTGNYDPPIPFIMNEMLVWSIGISVTLTLVYGIYRKVKK